MSAFKAGPIAVIYYSPKLGHKNIQFSKDFNYNTKKALLKQLKGAAIEMEQQKAIFKFEAWMDNPEFPDKE